MPEDLTDVFEQKEYPKEQFKSDAKIWEHTLFDKGNSGTKVEEKLKERRLNQQQDILKRHFLAMAILGIVATDSTKQKKVDETPLAAFASHGGRFAYEADDAECGQQFNNWLFNDGDKIFNYKNELSKLGNFKERGGTNSYAALYRRVSTHDQEYKKNKWEEINVQIVMEGYLPSFGKPCIGMNMALGGIGNQIKDLKQRDTWIKYEGWAKAKQTGKDDYTDYQLGAAIFVYKEAEKKEGGKTSRLMVGFEGTAPNIKNQLGAEHGGWSTIKHTIFHLPANERSLTGQQKASKIDLPHGMGALKSDSLNKDTLKQLVDIYKNFENLNEQKKHSFFEKLLRRNKQERKEIISEYLETTDF
ncbi:hypothetical protein [Nostoc sp.]|uniref:hypothetical protein n=1 Tax=Nostoc sp. TaxID=1180 RepID=UPI002FFA6C14